MTNKMSQEGDPTDTRVRTGVYGASGTSGAELIALLHRHPHAQVIFATSRSKAGQDLTEVDPAAPRVPLVHPDQVDPSTADVVFLCLPHGAAGEVAARCVDAGVRVVDVSGDHRLRSPALHEQIYASPRSHELAAEAVYGLTEYARPSLRQARLVANPGCYATAMTMALLPLAESGLLGELTVVDAKSGVSGAGRTPTSTTHFCSVTEDVRPYKPGRVHRHVTEVEQALTEHSADGLEHRLVFTPHLVPLERGIQATLVVQSPGLSADRVRAAWGQRYEGEPFVWLLPEGEAARIRAVSRTNRVALGAFDVDGAEAVVLTSAIDNLLKGAAGQAVQNMNAMLGLDERVGLPGAL